MASISLFDKSKAITDILKMSLKINAKSDALTNKQYVNNVSCANSDK